MRAFKPGQKQEDDDGDCSATLPDSAAYGEPGIVNGLHAVIRILVETHLAREFERMCQRESHGDGHEHCGHEHCGHNLQYCVRTEGVLSDGRGALAG
jgi:hypothetical protein